MNTEVIETEEFPGLPEGFHIDSDDRAEWLLRKLGNNAAEKARVLQQAQGIVASLDSDTAALLRRFGAELEEYTKAKLAAEGNKKKSVRFLQGTCAFRYQGPNVKVKDGEAALRWAKENAPALVTLETVETLDGEQFRKEALQIRTRTGELLPGVEYSEGGDVFNVLYPDGLKPARAKKTSPASQPEE